jgi:hypothetical protein
MDVLGPNLKLTKGVCYICLEQIDVVETVFVGLAVDASHEPFDRGVIQFSVHLLGLI